MSPDIASVVYALGILGFFLLDRDRESRTSPALWIPILWVSIGASRNVSEWLGGASVLKSPDQYLEGSPLDQLILGGLEAAALIVLVARGRRTGRVLEANGPILLFFLYGVVSVLWSDYPDVAFKRWIKAFGNILMVLVVMTDPDPSAAVKRLLARSAFLLIPVSVLLIKYYPELGRGYDRWTGTTYYTGVGIGKNSLGVVCLLFGLGSLWRLLEAFHSPKLRHMDRTLIAHGVLLAMALWLLWKANSATSLGCFLVGSSVLALTGIRRFDLTPTTVHILMVGIVSLCLFGLFADNNVDLARAMGRDATLSGRTVLWDELFRINPDPLLGVGFESYWLGERAGYLWEKYWWHPNQAHNGYIEIFLNLGWIGVALLCFVMVWGYRNVVGALQRDPELGGLKLAYFMVAVIYNLTEAAFKVMHPVWIVFLLAVTVVSEPRHREEG